MAWSNLVAVKPGGGGGVLPETFGGGGVRPASQTLSLSIYDQNL